MVSFLLMPLYTQILTTDEYGVVDIIVTYGNLLLPIVTMQMEQALFRFLIDARYDEQEKKDVLSDIISLVIIIVSLFTILYLCIAPLVKVKYKYYLLFNLWASVFSSMMLQSCRGLGKNIVYSLGSFISAAGQVILNIFFIVVLRLGVNGMISAIILAHVISGIYVALRINIFQYFKFRVVRKNAMIKYLRYSSPLVPNSISWWILSASDRSIILMFLGVSYNGIYSAASKFSGIYTTLYNIFNLSWTETVSLHLKDKDSIDEFKRIQSTVVRICITAALGLISIMPFLFNFLVDEKFDQAYYQIPLLTIGAYFSSMVGIVSAYYIADKKTTIIAKSSMLCAAINILVNLSLVKWIGLYASSISTIVAYFFLYIIRYKDIKKRFGINLENTLIISAAVMMIVISMAYYTRNILVCIISFIIYMGFTLVINRKLFISIYNELIK